MRSQVKRALVAAGITLAVSVATAVPVAAATTGSDWVRGVIVASGMSGARTVISSVAVAKRVFSGVGKIVGMPASPATLPTSAGPIWPIPGHHAPGQHDRGRLRPASTRTAACSAPRPRRTPTSLAGPGCSPMRLAASPAQSVPRGYWPATPTAAAPSGNHCSCCTRWTRSRSAEGCRSDPVLTTSTAAAGGEAPLLTAGIPGCHPERPAAPDATCCQNTRWKVSST